MKWLWKNSFKFSHRRKNFLEFVRNKCNFSHYFIFHQGTCHSFVPLTRIDVCLSTVGRHLSTGWVQSARSMRAGIKADSKDKYMRETCTHRRVQTLRNTRIVLFVHFESRFMVRKRGHGDVCTLIFDVYKSVLPENTVRSLRYIDRFVPFLLGNLCFGRFDLEYYKMVIIKLDEEIKDNNNIFELYLYYLYSLQNYRNGIEIKKSVSLWNNYNMCIL